ncbi:MAG: cysteine hydrolase [Desulfitobacterium sp.]|nr:cysteine hydrolase [Desulfitobacterium sp.]
MSKSKKRLLVVVDYQNDFTTGSLGSSHALALREGLLKKIKEYAKNGDEVWFTKDTHEESYLQTLEGSKLPIEHGIRGTEGNEIDSFILEGLEELTGGAKSSTEEDFPFRIIEKSHFPISVLTAKEIYDEGVEYEDITLCGVVTNICVISNAAIFRSIFPETVINIDASLCASNDMELHDKTLDVLESMQFNILNRG